jgi:hypothetical protein
LPDFYSPSSPAFENSPANGTDTQFQLNVWLVYNDFRYPNPIRYVNEDILHVYTGLPFIELDGSAYEVNQGTGVVTIYNPPASGTHLHFEIAPK